MIDLRRLSEQQNYPLCGPNDGPANHWAHLSHAKKLSQPTFARLLIFDSQRLSEWRRKPPRRPETLLWLFVAFWSGWAIGHFF